MKALDRRLKVIGLSPSRDYGAPIEDFDKLDMRVGRGAAAWRTFPEARAPAWKLEIDFGPELGVKRRRRSSRTTRLSSFGPAARRRRELPATRDRRLRVRGARARRRSTAEKRRRAADAGRPGRRARLEVIGLTGRLAGRRRGRGPAWWSCVVPVPEPDGSPGRRRRGGRRRCRAGRRPPDRLTAVAVLRVRRASDRTLGLTLRFGQRRRAAALLVVGAGVVAAGVRGRDGGGRRGGGRRRSRSSACDLRCRRAWPP